MPPDFVAKPVVGMTTGDWVMLNTLVIRGAAFCVLATGGVLYAMDAGVIGNQANDLSQIEQQGEVTLASASRAAPPFSLSPELPDIITSSDVLLPTTEAPISADAMAIPASFDLTPEAPALSANSQLSDLGLPCEVTVTAHAMPVAIVALDIMAPCRANAVVEIEHASMVLEAETDALGLLTLDIPGFTTPAAITVRFGDGIEETVSADLPDLADYDRIGLAWQGDIGLELHAMEAGAEFGGDGHIWLNAPASVEIAMAGEGGFLTEITTATSSAQIYTFPRAMLRNGADVSLSIDAPITAANCASNVLAHTLRTEAAGQVDAIELSFTVPGCDAVGDVLVLQNILDDMRLAAN